MEIDFEKEGLLEGVEGDARDARLDLLRRLEQDGSSLEELKQAAGQDRLAMLPIERALEPTGEQLTRDEIVERSGTDADFLDALWRALGQSLADPGERVYTEADVEAASRVAQFRDAGLEDESILEITRLMGLSMSQLATAIGRAFGEAFVQPGDTELDVGMRQASAARELGPAMGPTLGYVLGIHLRQQTRQAAIGSADLVEGRVRGGEHVTVCFADLVGFTRLGEQLPGDRLGAVAGRFTEVALDIVEPPVRLVKIIGDGAMLVSPEPAPVLETALALVDAADSEGEDFPQVHAGVAGGEALARGGDWFGHPVNLASRVSEVARPGSVLATADVHAAAEDGYRWSFAGERRLKGLKRPTKLYRARRPDAAGETEAPAS